MNESEFDLRFSTCAPKKPFVSPESILPVRAVGDGGVRYNLWSGLTATYILAAYALREKRTDLYDLHKKDAYVYLADDIDPENAESYLDLDKLLCVEIYYDERNIVGYFCLSDGENCERFISAYDEAYWSDYDRRTSQENER